MSANAPEIAEALSLLGDAYRGDWSDFDGRTLRYQLNELAEALTTDAPFSVRKWAAAQSICTKTRGWAEHCEEKVPLPDDHPARARGRLFYGNDCVHLSAVLDEPTATEP